MVQTPNQVSLDRYQMFLAHHGTWKQLVSLAHGVTCLLISKKLQQHETDRIKCAYKSDLLAIVTADVDKCRMLSIVVGR